MWTYLLELGGHISRNRIVLGHMELCLAFVRNYQAICTVGHIILNSHQQSMRVAFSLHSCGFVLCFSNSKWCWAFFHELSYIAGVNIKWYSYFGRQFAGFTNILLAYDLAILLLGLPKGVKTNVHTKTCTLMFIAALFMIAKTWKQRRYLSVGEWINKRWYIHMIEYHWALKEMSY